MRKWLLAALAALVVSGCLFYGFGRAVWHPYWVQLRGAKSVGEAVREIAWKEDIRFDATDWDRLVLLGLKEERVLEVWGIGPAGATTKIAEFPFTGYSGELGPKLREGDRQIPEGIYAIEYLNPNSSYHLSMKVDYPNKFDREKGRADGRDDLGYDIFIHGRSSTVGCIPIGDEGIEQLFQMVAEIGKENVEVIVAPYDMRKGIKHLEIPGIDWEQELYTLLADAIGHRFPKQDGGSNPDP